LWTGFSWLRIGFSSYEHGNKPDSIEGGLFSPTERPWASQEEFCPTELVIQDDILHTTVFRKQWNTNCRPKCPWLKGIACYENYSCVAPQYIRTRGQSASLARVMFVVAAYGFF
jgi:hypothetical protein